MTIEKKKFKRKPDLEFFTYEDGQKKILGHGYRYPKGNGVNIVFYDVNTIWVNTKMRELNPFALVNRT